MINDAYYGVVLVVSDEQIVAKIDTLSSGLGELIVMDSDRSNENTQSLVHVCNDLSSSYTTNLYNIYIYIYTFTIFRNDT